MSDPRQEQRLVKTLQRFVRNNIPHRMRQGTVTQVNASGYEGIPYATVSVTLGGGSTAIPMRYMSYYTPTVGDGVWVHQNKGDTGTKDYICIGTLA